MDIEKYRIKGGMSMFNKDNPNLIDEINTITKKMQNCCINKTLYPKLLFIKKYMGDINKIKKDGRIMVFDRNVGDFISKSNEPTKLSWDKKKKEVLNVKDFYTKKETISLLKDGYLNYLGKSGNRKLMRDDIKLYSSVYFHTKNMDKLSKQQKKFSHRLYILINNINIFCEKHNRIKRWNFIDKRFKIRCNDCEPKYPSNDWFKKKYGDDWEVYKNKRVEKTKNNRTNSLMWFIKKYGKEGNALYRKNVEKQMKRIAELKKNRYSKISQDLFWCIYDKHKDKNNIYFHELNKEFVLNIPTKFNYDKTVMMLDFKYKNKIIEYNGTYWHDEKKDEIRYNILKKIGYDVLVVTSDEYNRNKKSLEIINKCNEFLLC